MKRCFKCGEEKPRAEFYAHKMMGDGLLGKCKECTKKDVAERYEKKRDYIADYELKRSKDPERKKKLIVYQRTRRARDPEKTKARNRFSKALASGRIVKPDRCSSCPSTDRVQGHHHNGYSAEHALDVIWLCFKCHRGIYHSHKVNC